MTTTMISKPSPLTPTETHHPAYSQSLPCTEESVGITRLSVAATLRAWGLEDLVDDARLIASELATNAIRHATRHTPDPEQRGSFRLKVERPSENLVRISTFDRSRAVPRVVQATETAESGRGMAAVEAVACRWGIDPKPWGKGIWAECAKDSPKPDTEAVILPAWCP
ncbi:ATP-binding protein [Streptomyces iranensis]|uniref:Anti-sigma regulatory factor (Ser/Thr protein kinase) n=1 Tax=Streptomyces iranensis TaxID=576784 RepID=A0A061A0W7_9ACTN|nr:ATP-binding protein [Streptomyces iranensis]MBP2061787.1 anti-sigma regulatory factor (Ser/Thr protein kinase) [Streptomyces iranensis]CDR09388.1 regulatory protein [Streptomyces iranensis]